MIKATILKDSMDNYKGFKLTGHAGYQNAGKDIICAAASVLAQNTVNSIEMFTEDRFLCRVDEQKGSLKFKFAKQVSPESKLLLDSMVLGLQSIREAYGSQYIRILFEEV